MPDSNVKNSTALAILRICIGMLFVIFGEYKIFRREFVFGGGFAFWINKFLQEGAYPFMAPVLRGFVLPHATALSLLVAYGEMAIGLSLVLGLFTRLASLAGVTYMAALLFSANYPGAHAPVWEYFGASLEHLVPALCFLAFLVGDSEAMLSVSSYAAKRK